MGRTGYVSGTLAVREGLRAPIPGLDPRVILSMDDMGHGGMDHGPSTASATGAARRSGPLMPPRRAHRRAGTLRREQEITEVTDDVLARAADLHALHAFVPALDDMALAERKLERVVAILGGIELAAIFEETAVMGGDQGALDGSLAVAQLNIFNP